jgi:carbon-monoxide dehydrogenase medium subunit
MRWRDYLIPETLEDAARALADHAGCARVVGGGTDYFVDEGDESTAEVLVDVTRIRSLRQIWVEADYVIIGCGATHAQIVASPIVQQHGAALAEACGQIGGPQVRNVATLAGNVAHALPAADGSIALLALGGEAQVAWAEAGKVHCEWRPLEQLFRGPGQSAIDSRFQIIAALRFPCQQAGEGSAFARVMRPQGVALPILGLALCLRLHDDGETIMAARLALGPVAPVPFRARQTEAFLVGRRADEQTLSEGVAVLSREVNPRTSPHRATADYRREVLPVLFKTAWQAAVTRVRVS